MGPLYHFWGEILQHARMLSRSLCPTLCDPMDCSPPGCIIHGILPVRIVEWVALPSSGDLPDPGIEPESPALASGFFTTEPPGKQHTI